MNSAAFLTVVCALLLAGCSPKATPVQEISTAAESATESNVVRLPSGSPQLSRIKVAAVETKRVALDEVVAPGKIEANPNRISRVALPLAGRIRQVMISVGDSVSQEQVLLTVESPDASTATANYQQTRAKLNESRAAMAKAETDLSRQKELFAGRATAQKDVLSAEASLAQARSALEQAQASQGESERRLALLGIAPGESNPAIAVRSPLSGKVLEIAVASGEYRNDTSAPLMTIADLSSVFMTADVPETQIRLITKGETAEITLAAYPGEVFTATVARIADVVDPQTRTIKVRAVLKNAEGRFRPEMFGEIRHKETFRDVAVLPTSAIIQGEQRSLIFREKAAGVYEPVTVTCGKEFGGQVPVLTGVHAGERVVIDGAMLLKGMQ